MSTSNYLSEDVDLSPEATAKAGVILSSLDWIYNWSRSNSVWPLQFGLACCAIEMISTAGIASRHSAFWS